MNTFCSIEHKLIKVEPIEAAEDLNEVQSKTHFIPLKRCLSFRILDKEESSWNELEVDFWEIYKKERKIGEGSTGSVYLCKENSTGKQVAVKVIRTTDDEMIFSVNSSYFNRVVSFRVSR